MAAITTTTISNALGVWNSRKLNRVLHGKQHRPVLNLMRKQPTGGEDYRVDILTDWGGQTSYTFAEAQSYGGNPVLGRFKIGENIPDPLHRTVQLDSKALLVANGDPKKNLSKAILRTEQMIEPMADDVERQLIQGDGYNSLATVVSVSTASCVVTPARAARYFRPGMAVRAAATKGGNWIDSAAKAIVLSSKGTTGVVTFTANLSTTLASLAATNFLFESGSGTASANTRLGTIGLAGYASVPVASESFLGEDRTVAPDQMAMVRFTSGSLSDIQKAILDADALAEGVNGGMRNKCLLSTINFAVLSDTLTSQVRYTPATPVRAGFKSINIQGGSSEIEIVSSTHVNDDEFFVLDWDSMHIAHLGDTPVFIDDLDGSMARKQAAASGIEIRSLASLHIANERPGCSVYGTLS